MFIQRFSKCWTFVTKSFLDLPLSSNFLPSAALKGWLDKSTLYLPWICFRSWQWAPAIGVWSESSSVLKLQGEYWNTSELKCAHSWTVAINFRGLDSHGNQKHSTGRRHCTLLPFQRLYISSNQFLTSLY